MRLSEADRQKYFEIVLKRFKNTLIPETKKLLFPDVPYDQSLNRSILKHSETILRDYSVFIKEQFNAFLTFLAVTEAHIGQAPNLFFDVPVIKNFVLILCKKIQASIQSAEDQDSVPKNPVNCFSSEIMQQHLQTWVNEHYDPLDQREHLTDDLKPKRMDSLARLLAVDTNSSACSAVTIDTSNNNPRMIIALNVTTDGDQERIYNDANTKLTIIKHHLLDAADFTPESEETEQAIDELTEEIKRRSGQLITTLKEKTTTNLPSDYLEIAAKKTMFSYYLNDAPFNNKEKSAFLLSAPVIFLLPKTGAHGLQMQVIEVTSSGTIISEIELTGLPDEATVRGIHAEQMINQFLFRSIKSPPNSPRVIGTSKLCCETCIDSIQRNPKAIVRGHSGKLFAGTVNLYTGAVTPSSSGPRHALSEAKPSPHFTPEERLKNGKPGEAKKKIFGKRRSLTNCLEEIYLEDTHQKIETEIFISPNAVESNRKVRKTHYNSIASSSSSSSLLYEEYGSLPSSSSNSSLENHCALDEEIDSVGNNQGPKNYLSLANHRSKNAIQSNPNNVSDCLHERCNNLTMTITSPNAVESANPGLSPKSPNTRINRHSAHTGRYNLFGSHTASNTANFDDYPMLETVTNGHHGV